MALDQLAVIEGDGTQNTVTVTDDPAQNATIQAVVDRLERVLKGQDNLDEVRVALTNDDLPGNIDVSVEDQTGDVAVTLGGETVSVDSLPSLPQGSSRIGSVVVDGQPIGVSVDGQTGDLEVTLGTETVSVDSLPAVDISSQSAGIATESTLDAIKTAAQALDDALASSGTDEIRVTSPSPLDVSGAEVDVNLTSQGLQNVSVDLASDSLAGNLDVDLAGQSVGALDVSAAEVDVNLNSDSLAGNLDVDLAAASAEPLDVSAATVSVQEDTPLDVSAAEVDVDLASQTGAPLDVSGATVAVQEASALDVSAATVEVQEATALDVSGATVPTEQQTPVQVEDSSGTNIDPATEGKLESVRALLDGLGDALASVAGDTLRTEQQSPVAVEDSTGTQIDPASNPEIRGGATLQDVVDATGQAALALATDHPARTRVGLDLSSGDVEIGPIQIQRTSDLIVAANPTGGGNVTVDVKYTDGQGATFLTKTPISGASTESEASVSRRGTHAVVTASGTDSSTNLFIDTTR